MISITIFQLRNAPKTLSSFKCIYDTLTRHRSQHRLHPQRGLGFVQFKHVQIFRQVLKVWEPDQTKKRFSHDTIFWVIRLRDHASRTGVANASSEATYDGRTFNGWSGESWNPWAFRASRDLGCEDLLRGNWEPELPYRTHAGGLPHMNSTTQPT